MKKALEVRALSGRNCGAVSSMTQIVLRVYISISFVVDLGTFNASRSRRR
jgi:hypothetical protein